MVLNTVLNSISDISWQLAHLSMFSWSSFNQYSKQYSLQATGCFPTKPSSKQWLSWGLKQRPPVPKFCTLPTELWGFSVILKSIHNSRSYGPHKFGRTQAHTHIHRTVVITNMSRSMQEGSTKTFST